MATPLDRFETVAAVVNAFPEVAHNYARDHRLNMWFVLATETEADIGRIIAEIERLTDIKVLNLPKLEEYFIGLKVDA
jgi:DNA-binding Lrp family transcriptional regulator